MEYDPDSDDDPEQDVAWQGFSECTRWYHSQCVTEDGTIKCKHSLKVFLRTLIALMTDFRLELSQNRLFCRVILMANLCLEMWHYFSKILTLKNRHV